LLEVNHKVHPGLGIIGECGTLFDRKFNREHAILKTVVAEDFAKAGGNDALDTEVIPVEKQAGQIQVWTVLYTRSIFTSSMRHALENFRSQNSSP
jgi:hypothetical protein